MNEQLQSADNSINTIVDEPSYDDNSNIVDNEPANDGDQQNSDNEQNNDVNSDEQDEQHQQSGEGGEQPRFKTIEDATKSFNELQKKLGRQSNELGELRKKAGLVEKLQQEQLQLAQTYGFENIEQFKAHQQEQQYNSNIARFEADAYAKYINQAEYPDQIRNLLIEYRNNPSPEILEAIEADFPLDIVKKVSGDVALYRGQLAQQQRQAQDEALYNSAKEYLDINVNKYSQEFQNQAFAKLYAEAFKGFGCELNTDLFVNLMNEFKESVIKDYQIKNGIRNDNISATDEIASLSSSVGNNTNYNSNEKNILNMSEAEMLREIRKYK